MRTALKRPITDHRSGTTMIGVSERAAFRDEVKRAIAIIGEHVASVAVLLIDLDNFRTINHTLGHRPGDLILADAADRILHELRPETTVAYLGGDEFAVLLDDVPAQDDPIAIAERLLESLRRPFVLEGRALFLSGSIGIASCTSVDTSPDNLLREVDIALYMAKRDGRGCYALFESGLQQSIAERLVLETDLQQAVQQESFALHYQPIIDLGSRTMTNMEALVRWIHPTRGTVLPSDFVPLAEETGLILPIGRWVLRTACNQMRRWQDSTDNGHDMGLSVNISSIQLQNDSIFTDVAAALLESGLNPRSLTLEITESVMMMDSAELYTKLKALKGLGVSLAIDDFGMGYSSLRYLNRFPIDVLKIDRSFTASLGHDLEDSSLAQAVISLGHALDLPTVAEGIEEERQIDLLRQLGCARGQGFYFARPLTTSSMASLLCSPPPV